MIFKNDKKKFILNWIQKILKKVRNNEKLMFNKTKKEYLIAKLTELATLIIEDPEYAIGIIVSLHSASKIYGFEKEFTILKNAYLNKEEAFIGYRKIKPIAYT
ncbi:MAG: hypothetical protein ACTSPY_09470 [Candidatus Helarchaeota archaeon]